MYVIKCLHAFSVKILSWGYDDLDEFVTNMSLRQLYR